MKMILYFSLLALHFIRRIMGVICSFLSSFISIYIFTLFMNQFQTYLDTIMEFVELQRGDAKAR